MKDEGWRMDEGWMKDEGWNLNCLRGFGFWETNEQTVVIVDCRVAFATENSNLCFTWTHLCWKSPTRGDILGTSIAICLKQIRGILVSLWVVIIISEVEHYNDTD